MEQLIITGGNRLTGHVNIDGAKNAALAVLPAVLCANGPCVIENLPMIDDIACSLDMLSRAGANILYIDKNTVRIDPAGIKSMVIDFESAKKIRTSYYMLGVYLGLFGEAAAVLPGGCDFGSRPIDYHIKGFEAMGAAVNIEGGIVYVKAEELRGTQIIVHASVGATVNLMLAAVNATGQTILEEAAREPHVVDVANFLNFIGADIRGAGTNTIRINGKDMRDQPLRHGNYTIIPDMIEAGTFMIAAAITGGDVTAGNIIPKHMDSLSAKLREMNCVVEESEDAIRVRATELLHPINVKTQPYPGFPTDLQPQMGALLATVKGTSIVRETIFDSRYQYVSELERMGAKITVLGREAVFDGVPMLKGAAVAASDLRAGMALIIAGLAAEGQTRLSNLHFVDRGYSDIDEKLRALGADVVREKIM